MKIQTSFTISPPRREASFIRCGAYAHSYWQHDERGVEIIFSPQDKTRRRMRVRMSNEELKKLIAHLECWVF